MAHTVSLGPLQVPGGGLSPSQGADGVGQRPPLRQVTAQLQRLAAPRQLQRAHVCRAGHSVGSGGDFGPTKPHCAALTLGHLVQQHRDLLVLQQPALEEGDEDTVGELALAQLVGFGIRASVGMGRVGSGAGTPTHAAGILLGWDILNPNPCNPGEHRCSEPLGAAWSLVQP